MNDATDVGDDSATATVVVIGDPPAFVAATVFTRVARARKPNKKGSSLRSRCPFGNNSPRKPCLFSSSNGFLALDYQHRQQ